MRHEGFPRSDNINIYEKATFETRLGVPLTRSIICFDYSARLWFKDEALHLPMTRIFIVTVRAASMKAGELRGSRLSG